MAIFFNEEKEKNLNDLFFDGFDKPEETEEKPKNSNQPYTFANYFSDQEKMKESTDMTVSGRFPVRPKPPEKITIKKPEINYAKPPRPVVTTGTDYNTYFGPKTSLTPAEEKFYAEIRDSLNPIESDPASKIIGDDYFNISELPDDENKNKRYSINTTEGNLSAGTEQLNAVNKEFKDFWGQVDYSSQIGKAVIPYINYRDPKDIAYQDRREGLFKTHGVDYDYFDSDKNMAFNLNVNDFLEYDPVKKIYDIKADTDFTKRRWDELSAVVDEKGKKKFTNSEIYQKILEEQEEKSTDKLWLTAKASALKIADNQLSDEESQTLASQMLQQLKQTKSDQDALRASIVANFKPQEISLKLGTVNIMSVPKDGKTTISLDLNNPKNVAVAKQTLEAAVKYWKDEIASLTKQSEKDFSAKPKILEANKNFVEASKQLAGMAGYFKTPSISSMLKSAGITKISDDVITAVLGKKISGLNKYTVTKNDVDELLSYQDSRDLAKKYGIPYMSIRQALASGLVTSVKSSVSNNNEYTVYGKNQLYYRVDDSNTWYRTMAKKFLWSMGPKEDRAKISSVLYDNIAKAMETAATKGKAITTAQQNADILEDGMRFQQELYNKPESQWTQEERDRSSKFKYTTLLKSIGEVPLFNSVNDEKDDLALDIVQDMQSAILPLKGLDRTALGTKYMSMVTGGGKRSGQVFFDGALNPQFGGPGSVLKYAALDIASPIVDTERGLMARAKQSEKYSYAALSKILGATAAGVVTTLEKVKDKIEYVSGLDENDARDMTEAWEARYAEYSAGLVKLGITDNFAANTAANMAPAFIPYVGPVFMLANTWKGTEGMDAATRWTMMGVTIATMGAGKAAMSLALRSASRAGVVAAGTGETIALNQQLLSSRLLGQKLAETWVKSRPILLAGGVSGATSTYMHFDLNKDMYTSLETGETLEGQRALNITMDIIFGLREANSLRKIAGSKVVIGGDVVKITSTGQHLIVVKNPVTGEIKRVVITPEQLAKIQTEAAKAGVDINTQVREIENAEQANQVLAFQDSYRKNLVRAFYSNKSPDGLFGGHIEKIAATFAGIKGGKVPRVAEHAGFVPDMSFIHQDGINIRTHSLKEMEGLPPVKIEPGQKKNIIVDLLKFFKEGEAAFWHKLGAKENMQVLSEMANNGLMAVEEGTGRIRITEKGRQMLDEHLAKEVDTLAEMQQRIAEVDEQAPQSGNSLERVNRFIKTLRDEFIKINRKGAPKEGRSTDITSKQKLDKLWTQTLNNNSAIARIKRLIEYVASEETWMNPGEILAAARRRNQSFDGISLQELVLMSKPEQDAVYLAVSEGLLNFNEKTQMFVNGSYTAKSADGVSISFENTGMGIIERAFYNLGKAIESGDYSSNKEKYSKLVAALQQIAGTKIVGIREVEQTAVAKYKRHTDEAAEAAKKRPDEEIQHSARMRTKGRFWFNKFIDDNNFFTRHDDDFPLIGISQLTTAKQMGIVDKTLPITLKSTTPDEYGRSFEAEVTEDRKGTITAEYMSKSSDGEDLPVGSTGPKLLPNEVETLVDLSTNSQRLQLHELTSNNEALQITKVTKTKDGKVTLEAVVVDKDGAHTGKTISLDGTQTSVRLDANGNLITRNTSGKIVSIVNTVRDNLSRWSKHAFEWTKLSDEVETVLPPDNLALRTKNGQTVHLARVKAQDGALTDSWVSIQDGTVISNDALKTLLMDSSYGWEMGTLKLEDALLVKSTPDIFESALSPDVLSKLNIFRVNKIDQQVNTQTLLRGHGILRLGGIEINLTAEEGGWTSATALKFAVSEDGSVVIGNRRTHEILARLGNDDVPVDIQNGFLITNEIFKTYQQSIDFLSQGGDAEILAQNLGLRDVDEARNLMAFVNNGVESGQNFAFAKLDRNSLFQSRSVRFGEQTAWSKLYSTIRHELIHKAIIDKIIAKGLSKGNILESGQFFNWINNRSNTTSIDALAEILAKGNSGYSKIAATYLKQRKGNYYEFIHEILAHSSSKSSLKDGLKLRPEELKVYDEAFLEVVTGLSQLDGDIPEILKAYQDPEIKVGLEDYQYANRQKTESEYRLGDGGEVRPDNAEFVPGPGDRANLDSASEPARGVVTRAIEKARRIRADIRDNGLFGRVEPARVLRSVESGDYLQNVRGRDATLMFPENSRLSGLNREAMTRQEPGSLLTLSQGLRFGFGTDVDNGVISMDNFHPLADPYFVVDPTDAGSIVVNDRQKAFLLDLFRDDGFSSKDNPYVKAHSDKMTMFTGASTEAWTRIVANTLDTHLKSNSPLIKLHSPAEIDQVINFLEQISGKTFLELSHPISNSELNAMRTDKNPFIMNGLSTRHRDYDIYRGLMFHENVNRAVYEMMGMPNKYAYREALDVLGKSPKFQRAYKQIFNRQGSNLKRATIDDVVMKVLSGASDPNMASEFGFHSFENFEFATLYGTVLSAIAKTHGVDSANYISRLADPALHEFYQKRILYSDSRTEIKHIAATRRENSESGPRMLYSIDAESIADPGAFALDAEQMYRNTGELLSNQRENADLTGYRHVLKIAGENSDLTNMPQAVARELEGALRSTRGTSITEVRQAIKTKYTPVVELTKESINNTRALIDKPAEVITQMENGAVLHENPGVPARVYEADGKFRIQVQGDPYLAKLEGMEVKSAQEGLNIISDEYARSMETDLSKHTEVMDFLNRGDLAILPNVEPPPTTIPKSYWEMTGTLHSLESTASIASEMLSTKQVLTSPLREFLVESVDPISRQTTTKSIPEKATGADWQRFLLNKGIKFAELDWTSTKDFLQENAGRVITREELASFADKHQVVVQKRVLRPLPEIYKAESRAKIVELSDAKSEVARLRNELDAITGVRFVEGKIVELPETPKSRELYRLLEKALERESIAYKKYKQKDVASETLSKMQPKFSDQIIGGPIGDIFNMREHILLSPRNVKGQTGTTFAEADLPYNTHVQKVYDYGENINRYKIVSGRGRYEMQESGMYFTPEEAIADYFTRLDPNHSSAEFNHFAGVPTLESSRTHGFRREYDRVGLYNADGTPVFPGEPGNPKVRELTEVQSDSYQRGNSRGTREVDSKQRAIKATYESLDLYGKWKEKLQRIPDIFLQKSSVQKPSFYGETYSSLAVERMDTIIRNVTEKAKAVNLSTEQFLKAYPDQAMEILRVNEVTRNVRTKNSYMETFKYIYEARLLYGEYDAARLHAMSFRVSSEQKGLPEVGPFQKNWVEVLGKSSLKDAVDDGIEFFVWTPAKTQIERWSTATRKNLDRIEYYRPMLVENDAYPSYTRLINSEINSAKTPEQKAALIESYTSLSKKSFAKDAWESAVAEVERTTKAFEEIKAKRDAMTPDEIVANNIQYAYRSAESEMIQAQNKKQFISRELYLDLTRFKTEANQAAVYRGLSNDTVHVRGYKNGKLAFDQVLPLEGTTSIKGQTATLEGIVGTKMAKEMKSNQIGFIENENLSVGGEFYQRVYDTELTKIFNKLIKPHGGEIETFYVKNPDGELVEMHGFKIPEGLKKNVKEKGLTMYSLEDPSAIRDDFEINLGKPAMTEDLFVKGLKYGHSAIISFKDNANPSTDNSRYLEAKNWLEANHLAYQEVKGYWTGEDANGNPKQFEETSFMITGIGEGIYAYAELFANKFKQNAYITLGEAGGSDATMHNLTDKTSVTTTKLNIGNETGPTNRGANGQLEDGTYVTINGKTISFEADFNGAQTRPRQDISDAAFEAFINHNLQLRPNSRTNLGVTLSDVTRFDLETGSGRPYIEGKTVVDLTTLKPVGEITNAETGEWVPYPEFAEKRPYLLDGNGNPAIQQLGSKDIPGWTTLKERAKASLLESDPDVTAAGKRASVKGATQSGDLQFRKKGTFVIKEGLTSFAVFKKGKTAMQSPQAIATLGMQEFISRHYDGVGIEIPKMPEGTRETNPAEWDLYYAKTSAIQLNALLATGEQYLSGSGGRPPEFYTTGMARLLKRMQADIPVEQASEAIHMLKAAILSLTSKSTTVEQNKNNALNIFLYLHEMTSGDKLKLPLAKLVENANGDIEFTTHKTGPKAGKRVLFNVSTSDLIKFQMLLEGYVPVDSKTKGAVDPRNIIGQSSKQEDLMGGTIPEEVKRIGKFTKNEELAKLIEANGQLAGVMEYLLQEIPGSDGSMMRAQEIIGPKLGTFMLNLAGLTDVVTIDRHMHRWFKLQVNSAITATRDDQGRITKIVDWTQDAPEGYEQQLYQGLIQKAAVELSRKYNVDFRPRELQQLVWDSMINANEVTQLPSNSRLSSGTFDNFLSGSDAVFSNSKLTDVLKPYTEESATNLVALGKGQLERFARNKVRDTASFLHSTESLDAQQTIINLSEPLLHAGDADTWIDAAERLVAGNTAATMRGRSLLADSEKAAIKSLAEQQDIEGLQKYTLGLNKQTPLELFVNVGRVFLLLGVRNIVKNAIGNSLRSFMDEVSRVPASVMDTVFIHANKVMGGTNLEKSTTSLLTNPLETLGAYKEAFKGAGKQGVQEFIDVLRGKNRDIIFEHPSLFRERTTGWKVLKPLEILERYGWRLQGAMDRPFNAFAYHRALREIQAMRLRQEHKADNIISMDEAENYLTPMDYQLAEEYALAATYQKNNTVSDKYYGFVDGLPPTWRAIITNITKFVKTPLNVVDYILDYSGVWPMIKMAHREFNTTDYVNWKRSIQKVMDNPQDRRTLSMALSQGAIGTIMMHVGYKMAEAGMLTAWYDKEERREQEQQEAKGTSAGKVNMLGYSMDLSFMTPNIFWLTAGATDFRSKQKFDEKLTELEKGLADATQQENQEKILEFTEKLKKHRASSPAEETLSRMLKNFALQAPFLRQINDIVEAWNTDTTFSTLGGKWVSPETFVPAISKEIAEAKDEYERVVTDESFFKTAVDKIQKNIPTLPGISDLGKALEGTEIPGISQIGKVMSGRENLPAKVDMFGRPIQAPSGLSGPFKAQDVRPDFLSQEMDRFNLTITKPEGGTSVAENEMRRIKGEIFRPILDSVVNSTQYQNVPDAYKKRMLEYAIRSTTQESKKDKFSPADEKFNLTMMLNREEFKSNLINNPDLFKGALKINDKEILRLFAGANIPPNISMSQIISDLRKEGIDKFIDDKFMYELMVSDKQTAIQAQTNYNLFEENPQLTLIRWWASNKRSDASRDRVKERRAELLAEGKSKEEVEKIIRKESGVRGAETRLKLKNFSIINITP